jgi:hypothetical protein
MQDEREPVRDCVAERYQLVRPINLTTVDGTFAIEASAFKTHYAGLGVANNAVRIVARNSSPEFKGGEFHNHAELDRR